MFLGLRMMEGVSMEKFERYFGKPYMEVYGKVQKKMEDKRFLINDNGYVKLTEFGIDLSNYVMSEFCFKNILNCGSTRQVTIRVINSLMFYISII